MLVFFFFFFLAQDTSLHSPPLTHSSLSATTKGHTGDIFHTLTSQTVPGGVKEIFGAGDGDHLADLGTGPAGDLVPHPTAS